MRLFVRRKRRSVLNASGHPRPLVPKRARRRGRSLNVLFILKMRITSLGPLMLLKSSNVSLPSLGIHHFLMLPNGDSSNLRWYANCRRNWKNRINFWATRQVDSWAAPTAFEDSRQSGITWGSESANCRWDFRNSFWITKLLYISVIFPQMFVWYLWFSILTLILDSCCYLIFGLFCQNIFLKFLSCYLST